MHANNLFQDPIKLYNSHSDYVNRRQVDQNLASTMNQLTNNNHRILGNSDSHTLGCICGCCPVHYNQRPAINFQTIFSRRNGLNINENENSMKSVRVNSKTNCNQQTTTSNNSEFPQENANENNNNNNANNNKNDNTNNINNNNNNSNNEQTLKNNDTECQ